MDARTLELLRQVDPALAKRAEAVLKELCLSDAEAEFLTKAFNTTITLAKEAGITPQRMWPVLASMVSLFIIGHVEQRAAVAPATKRFQTLLAGAISMDMTAGAFEKTGGFFTDGAEEAARMEALAGLKANPNPNPNTPWKDSAGAQEENKS